MIVSMLCTNAIPNCSAYLARESIELSLSDESELCDLSLAPDLLGSN